jgi:hypothetical protein
MNIILTHLGTQEKPSSCRGNTIGTGNRGVIVAPDYEAYLPVFHISFKHSQFMSFD